jgi:hypothetical protein
MNKPILSLLALAFASGNAAAMHLDHSGLGQVLIAPYYTVSGGNQTQISIGNRSDQGKALKIRFLEGMNGREVFGFNLYLAPHDIWTGALFSLSDQGAATLITQDDSCTVPALKHSSILPQLPNGRRIAPFNNAQFSGASDDAGPDDLMRTREGYFEIIEMGEVINAAQRSLNDISPGADGIPANCARIEAAWAAGGYWTQNAQADLAVPGGDLTATVTLVDALKGTMHSYQADAIDGFSAVVQHSPPGHALPNLASAVTRPNDVFVDAVVPVAGVLIAAQYPSANAVDAVSALLMAETVNNEFVSSPSVGGQSTWVVTLPTKKFYADDALLQGTAIAPFTKTFTQIYINAPVGSNTIFPPRPLPTPAPPEARGEAMHVDVRNRDRGPFSIGQYCNANPLSCLPFSAHPPEGPVVIPSIHWASNVFAFNSSQCNQLLSGSGGRLCQTIDAAALGVYDGWMQLRFYDAQGADSLPEHMLRADATGQRFAGLPAVGFWAMSYTNGQLLPGVLANYASIRRHSAVRRLLPAAP